MNPMHYGTIFECQMCANYAVSPGICPFRHPVKGQPCSHFGTKPKTTFDSKSVETKVENSDEKQTWTNTTGGFNAL